MERKEELREEFIKQLGEILPEDIIYLDESGIDDRLVKEYGWNIRGKRLMGERPGNRKKAIRYSIIAALSNKKLTAPSYFESYINTEIFNSWIEQALLPELQAKQVVVMDNAAFHKSARTKELIESKGCRIMFLPPYSPDLNPIEHKWYPTKQSVRKNKSKYSSFSEVLDMVLRGQ